MIARAGMAIWPPSTRDRVTSAYLRAVAAICGLRSAMARSVEGASRRVAMSAGVAQARPARR
ncbi:hypothetical protein CWN80_09930 [Janibacter hoylei PVAS-1]|uniref:Uncharacterized protein n=1 Tax=Janibacter hoylei PVAS-1 TaxID=1210046 RepID=A0A444B3Y9_9MICO|nr:hypothetical protein CWN80_09930 [Janibacter hoylei PVAS-1]